jgi:hyperosmotically inducible protein
MKTKLVMTCLVCGMLLGPAVTMAQDSDADRSHPKAFVKDSAITTEIKTKLAAEHITSLGRIHVDTDKDGVVWLSGSARTQEAIDKAVSIARETKASRTSTTTSRSRRTTESPARAQVHWSWSATRHARRTWRPMRVVRYSEIRSKS